jgi:hypothetical protein
MSTAKSITNEISKNINTQKILFRFLFTSSIILFAVYIYLIGSITFNVVARKSLENTIASLNGHINQLELTYLNKINDIDKDYALSNGFVDVKQNVFATRDITHVALR